MNDNSDSGMNNKGDEFSSYFGDNQERTISKEIKKTSSLELEPVEDNKEPEYVIPGISEQYKSVSNSSEAIEISSVHATAEDEQSSLSVTEGIPAENDQVSIYRESLTGGPLIMGVTDKKSNPLKKQIIIWTVSIFLAFFAGGAGAWFYSGHKLKNDVVSIVSKRAIYENTGALLKDVKKIKALNKEEDDTRKDIMIYGSFIWILVGSAVFAGSIAGLNKLYE